MLKKMFYVALGFASGVLFAVVGVGELRAQYGFDDSSSGYKANIMKPSLPGKYGQLVAVSDMNMYFVSQDGTVTIVRPKTGEQLDTTVTVLKRS
ncbi:MAG: hypothetical protein PHH75_05820 [Candidatus Omnitrophica bacterium]|nr:hypothetical protein [Candidatus Omnitrophota bacterium]MDD5574679.1 hypothetical protein [Candidatus Omnitrophota bacterium]